MLQGEIIHAQTSRNSRIIGAMSKSENSAANQEFSTGGLTH